MGLDKIDVLDSLMIYDLPRGNYWSLRRSAKNEVFKKHFLFCTRIDTSLNTNYFLSQNKNVPLPLN